MLHGEKPVQTLLNIVLRNVPLQLEADPQTQGALLAQFQDGHAGFWRTAYGMAPAAALKASSLEFALPVLLGLWALWMLLPWTWIALIIGVAYVLGLPSAYLSARLEMPKTNALWTALLSWWYIARRRARIRD